ncbi:MAG TPA: hypothetical protein VLB73_04620 [Patescibacteria group bacterium]|nr:hypothetical protein [Patescibacteria group bacterium]
MKPDRLRPSTQFAKKEYEESEAHSVLLGIQKRTKGKLSPIPDDEHGVYGEKVVWSTRRGKHKKKEHEISISASGFDERQQLTISGRREKKVGRFATEEIERLAERAYKHPKTVNAMPGSFHEIMEAKEEREKRTLLFQEVPLMGLLALSLIGIGEGVLHGGLTLHEAWEAGSSIDTAELLGSFGILLGSSTVAVLSHLGIEHAQEDLKEFEEEMNRRLITTKESR